MPETSVRYSTETVLAKTRESRAAEWGERGQGRERSLEIPMGLSATRLTKDAPGGSTGRFVGRWSLPGRHFRSHPHRRRPDRDAQCIKCRDHLQEERRAAMG